MTKKQKKIVSVQEAIWMAVEMAGSQRELADQLTEFGHPISQASISYYCHDQRNPRLRTAIAIERWSNHKIKREWLIPELRNYK